MSKDFRSKCKLFSERLDVLNNLLTELKQQIILQDLSIFLDTQVQRGRHLISDFDWLEEIDIGGDSFNLINKSKNKYYSYVVYTKRPYHTIGLGFMYKKEVVSPHMEFEVERIIAKYSDEELEEISVLMDEAMDNINQDIDFLSSNSDIQIHEHYYGEYNKGFESRFRYETISDVVDDYKKR
jgi:hypothetical protein